MYSSIYPFIHVPTDDIWDDWENNKAHNNELYVKRKLINRTWLLRKAIALKDMYNNRK